jgi:hypothetical protein
LQNNPTEVARLTMLNVVFCRCRIRKFCKDVKNGAKI